MHSVFRIHREPHVVNHEEFHATTPRKWYLTITSPLTVVVVVVHNYVWGFICVTLELARYSSLLLYQDVARIQKRGTSRRRRRPPFVDHSHVLKKDVMWFKNSNERTVTYWYLYGNRVVSNIDDKWRFAINLFQKACHSALVVRADLFTLKEGRIVLREWSKSAVHFQFGCSSSCPIRVLCVCFLCCCWCFLSWTLFCFENEAFS